MLSDMGNDVAYQFGLVFELPEDLQQVYANLGIDLNRFNDSESMELPMPGRFVIDAAGIVRSTEVHPDYTRRPDPKELVDMLKSL